MSTDSVLYLVRDLVFDCGSFLHYLACPHVNCGPSKNSGVLSDLINECCPSGSREWDAI